MQMLHISIVFAMDSYDYEFEPVMNVMKRWYQHWYNASTTWLSSLNKFFEKNSPTENFTLICVACLVGIIIFYMISVSAHIHRTQQLEAERLDLEEQEDALLHEKKRINMLRKKMAKEYSRSVAFKTIMDQVGKDTESWPVLLVDQMLHMQEEIAELKKE